MANKFVWDGLEEFREALRNLPDHLAGQAGNIVRGSANAAAVRVRTNYGLHRRTGDLQKRVVVQESNAGRYGKAVVVKSTARHAHLFEFGTQARHTKAGDYRGIMPPAPPLHAFIPTIIKERMRMYAQLKDMLVREGLVVSGEADDVKRVA